MLRGAGFRPLEGKTKLNTAEWWIGDRGPFTVPVEKDGTSDYWRIQRLCDWYLIRQFDLQQGDDPEG
jgi:hypothetical protein